MIWTLCAFVLGVAAAQEPLVSRAETAARVTKHLGQFLKVPPEQIELVKASDETWPDATLGCPGRKPLGEPAATPGFAFTLSWQGRRYVYHSDRRGRFRRCETPKPIAPGLT